MTAAFAIVPVLWTAPLWATLRFTSLGRTISDGAFWIQVVLYALVAPVLCLVVRDLICFLGRCLRGRG